MVTKLEMSKFKITRNEINSKIIPELFELFNIHKLPLATANVEFEIKNVSVSVINAIRRTIIDEMTGYYMQLSEDSISPLTTDKFADHQFINNRINTIPLCYLIPPEIIKNLKLHIDVTNTSSEALFIHSGDLVATGVELTYPIFNPTFNLFTVQPGKRVVINDIFINSATGKDFAAANIACRATYKHLDIPEYSKSDTHTSEGEHNNFSGYKTSTLVSNPKHHLFNVLIPATTEHNVNEEVSSIFIDVCDNIISRLRIILLYIENSNKETEGIQLTLLELPSGITKGILIIPGETHTIGNLITKSISEIEPDIVSISFIVYENKVELVIQHTNNIIKVLVDAIQYTLSIFNNIKKNI